MHVSGDAAPVIRNGNRPICVQRYRNRITVTCQSLVDAVVDDLVHHVVQTRPIVRVADIHARTFSNCFKAFENLDAVCAVFFRCLLVFSHVLRLFIVASKL